MRGRFHWGARIAATQGPAYAGCMSLGEPVRTLPASVDETLPDYVLALERAAEYLPEDHHRLLRRAWSVGAAAQGAA